MSLRTALIGMGKMGKTFLSLFPEYEISCCHICTLDPEKHTTPYPISSSLEDIPWKEIDYIIDFSHADAMLERMEYLSQQGTPVVLGTTGWNHIEKDVLSLFTQKNCPLVWGSNFSMGMWCFQTIVQHSISLLSEFPQFDIGLFEAHHKAKKDAPSGTMLSIKQTISQHMPQKTFFHSAKEQDSGHDSIDIATLRAGDIPGTHMIWIDGNDEQITLSHAVRNRQAFARGAIEAGRLLLEHPGIWHVHELFSAVTNK